MRELIEKLYQINEITEEVKELLLSKYYGHEKVEVDQKNKKQFHGKNTLKSVLKYHQNPN